MLELLCSCLAGICSYQCDFMLSWHFGFKWHRPHIVFVSHPTWSLFNHVFPIPYLGFEGMPNPAVITTGSRCSLPDEKKVKSEFQFCECISSSFPAYPRCLVYIYGCNSSRRDDDPLICTDEEKFLFITKLGWVCFLTCVSPPYHNNTNNMNV